MERRSDQLRVANIWTLTLPLNLSNSLCRSFSQLNMADLCQLIEALWPGYELQLHPQCAQYHLYKATRWCYCISVTDQSPNQNSSFRSRDWLSANQGPVFPDLVGSWWYCIQVFNIISDIDKIKYKVKHIDRLYCTKLQIRDHDTRRRPVL